MERRIEKGACGQCNYCWAATEYGGKTLAVNCQDRNAGKDSAGAAMFRKQMAQRMAAYQAG